jgi:hypothetical protein
MNDPALFQTILIIGGIMVFILAIIFILGRDED